MTGFRILRDGARPARRRAEYFIGRSVLGLIALALGAVAFALLVVLVQTDSALVALDRRLAAALNDLVSGRPFALTTLGVVTDLGGSPAGWAVLSTLTVALLVRRQHRLALYVTATGLGAAVLSPAVKELVGRLRPVVEVPVDSAPGPSFPSGHALGSLVTYSVVLLVLLPVVPPRWRRTAVTGTVVLVGLIGLSRLALGVHFLSDVVAGWLLGLGWLAITTTAFRAWRRQAGRPVPPTTDGLAPEAAPALAPADDRAPTPAHPARRGAALAVAWVLLLGALLAAGWAVTQPLAGSAVDRLDIAVVRWFAGHRSPASTAVVDTGGTLGGTAVIVAMAPVVAVLALAVTRRWRPVLFLAAVLVGEVTLFLATASVIDRPRPPVPHLGPALPPTASFPSGHVSAAISLYGAVAVLVGTRTRAWWRWLVVAAAVLAVALVALARLYYGVHYPTDVLGSVLLAVSWLLACRYALRPGDPGGDGTRTGTGGSAARSGRQRSARSGRALRGRGEPPASASAQTFRRTRRTHMHGTRTGGTLAALAAAAALLTGCGGDTAGPETGVTLDDVWEDTASLGGEEVTVSSEAQRIISQRAFVVGGTEGGEPLLVLHDGTSEIDGESAVRVTGIVRQALELDDVVDLAQEPLVNPIYETHGEDPYLEATDVESIEN